MWEWAVEYVGGALKIGASGQNLDGQTASADVIMQNVFFFESL